MVSPQALPKVPKCRVATLRTVSDTGVWRAGESARGRYEAMARSTASTSSGDSAMTAFPWSSSFTYTRA